MNNAGILRPGALATLPVAEWNAMLAVNLTGYLLCAQAFVAAMLSRQLALEWGPLGVRSNCVSPGMVRTAMSEAFYQAQGVAATRANLVPARRYGMPVDIADAVLFLASPRAAYVTGQDLVVDGGLAQITMRQVPRPGFEA